MNKAFKFNPGFQSDDEAIANFIVRQEEFDAVVEAFSPPGLPLSSPRVLVVAPRGAGKTTLCRRVLAETRRSGRLSAQWHAIFLGEESYVVTTPGEFFLECLFHLRDQTPDAVLEEHYLAAVNATDEDALLHATFAALRSFAEGSGRRLLIVVENFHIILNDQIGAEASRLIALLADESLFGVLATSVAQSLSDEDAAGPLPGSYLRLTLQPLALEECHVLWEALTEQTVKLERIRPLQILTGGSPRLLHILADFMRTPSLQDLMANLNLLIDQNTEYFKSQLDALPSLERKVFAALLDAWDPRTAKQIAEAARVNTNVASAMLGRLNDRGAVVKGPGEGRAAIYYAAERLFNIYYLMRRRSHPSNRVRALVSFMTEYYDHDELVKTTALLAREACAVDPEQRGDYHSTFGAILSGAKDEELRQRILDETPREFIRSFRKDRALLQDDIFVGPQPSMPDDEAEFAAVITQFEAAADRGDFPEAIAILQACLKKRPDLSGAWLRLSLVHRRLDDHAAAVAAAQRAIELAPHDAWAWAVLGRAHLGADDLQQADLAFSEALKRDPTQIMAVVELSEIREEAGELEGAIQLYEAARAVGPMPDLLWSRFALMLMSAERSDEAEEVLRAGASEDPTHFDTRHILVDLLDETGRQGEAVEVLRSAASTLDTWQAWADLGSFLRARTDQLADARGALETALERGADRIAPFGHLARTLVDLAAPAEALTELAHAAIDRVSNKSDAWSLAGEIYLRLGKDRLAEEAYRTAVGFADAVGAKLGLARVLARNVERRAEAEALLRNMIEDPAGEGVCASSRELAELLVHRGDEVAADKVLNDALQKNNECLCCLLLHAQICARRGDAAKAAERFDAALALDDESITALTGLALVDPSQADDLITRALEIAPNSPRSLFARAKLLAAGSPEEQVTDLRAAVGSDGAFMPAILMLAPLEAQRGDAELALGRLRVALDRLAGQREWLADFVSSAMAVARLGFADRVLNLIDGHDAAATLEPLIVALQLTRGEQPRVAKEVLEVAKDIVQRSFANDAIDLSFA